MEICIVRYIYNSQLNKKGDKIYVYCSEDI